MVNSYNANFSQLTTNTMQNGTIEGLRLIQKMSFADKRRFVAHIRSLYGKRIVFTISKDAAANIATLTRNAYDREVAQELILRNSLQKALGFNETLD